MSSPLPPPPPLSSLRGTVQQHNAYILLHTPPNKPPPTFPPRGPESKVHKRLQVAALKWGGVVNWVWHPPATSPCSNPNSTAHDAVEPPDEDGENYSATVFSKNGRLEIPQVTLSNMEQVEDRIRQFAIEDSSSSESVANSGIGHEPDEVHMLICTHMARDCRCGVRGGAFARTVHEQIVQRGLFLGDGEKKVRLKLGEVGHVGGHQYAPNVLIYPFGDWYGVLAPEQVSTILDELSVAVDSCGVRPLGKTERPLLTSVKDHWRGRMGMSKEEQASLAQSLGLGQKQQQREDVDVAKD
ncbi:Sucrase/ferredoxin-like domain containing protein [Amanita muscaria]